MARLRRVPTDSDANRHTVYQTWIGIAALLVAALPVLYSCRPAGLGGSPSVTTTTGSPSSAAATAVSSDVPASAVGSQTPAPGSDSSCADDKGISADCAAPGAWLRVRAEPCDTVGLADALGLVGEQNVVLAEVKAASACWARPLPATGASAQELLSLASDPRVQSATAACMATVTGAQIPCSQPHRVELVGQWRSSSGQATQPAAVCEEAGRAYAQRTFEGANARIHPSYIAQAGSTRYRCVLVSDDPLTESLWHRPG